MSGHASPYEDPVPRGLGVVLATLRITVALQCWGWAAAWLHCEDSFGLGTLFEREGSHLAATLELVLTRVAAVLILCGSVTLFRPAWPLLLPVTAWFAFIALLGPMIDRDPLRPAIDAVRVAAPLGLLLLDLWPPVAKFSLGRALLALGFLRVGAALTFAGLGLRGLQQSRDGGPLVELVTRGVRQVLHWELTAAEAESTLAVYAALLLGLAVCLLLVRSRAIAGLMTLAGLLTALSYVVAQGPHAYPRALLHAADAGPPATLMLYWLLAVKEQPAITLPAAR